MDRIRLLPDSVSNQIAAGEVVNRPASVVKELMENAVDAGAHCVSVNFRNGGKDLIQVVDDGIGMSPADARMAFEKHATSKIREVDDIYRLSTFGFRGEALASIASVAEVELITRQADSEVGYRIEICGGRFAGQSPVAAAVGSQFLVKNLFFNIPGRKRFLDKSTTEARHMTAEFRRVALCHPEVAFKLYDNDTVSYDLPAASLRQRIVGVVGKSIAPNLLELGADTSVVRIEGYVGRPSAARQSAKDQYLFVNGRFFKSGYLHKAVLGAYDKLIPTGTQPPYFIYMTIDTDRIDVNVHPQKTEIKFEDSTLVWQIINASVREALARSGAVPPMDFDMDASVEIPVFKQGDSGNYHIPRISVNPDFNPFDKYGDMAAAGGAPAGYGDFVPPPRQVGDIAAQVPPEQSYEESLMEFIDGDRLPQQGELPVETPETVGRAVLVGGGYAAASIDGALAVVDLRRAYEAVLYSRYMMMLGSGNSVCQQLLFPETLPMSQDDCSLIGEYASDFADCGFDIACGDCRIEVAGVPADIHGAEIGETLYALLDVLREHGGGAAELRRDRLASAMARSGARCAALPATDDAATELIGSLMGCDNRTYTPSGFAVMTLLTEDEIKKRLK